MSKMSQLHADLTQQAYELGFESIEEAEANGYGVDYDNKELVKLDEEELAHEAWLKAKEIILADLKELRKEMEYIGMDEWIESVDNAMDFIEGVIS